MRIAFFHRLALLMLALWLSGCTVIDEIGQQIAMSPNSTPLPYHPLYVLAVSAGTYSNNELVIVDPKTWQVVRRIPLAIAAPWDFSRDPQGRIWIGDGAEPGVHRLVQVFAPDGRLREGIWRGGIGYDRDVPLNNTNTDINWSSAPAWHNCCSGTATTAQGGDILSYP